MPITNRFSTTTNGALAITGNTLGLSKISNQNRAGTIGQLVHSQLRILLYK